MFFDGNIFGVTAALIAGRKIIIASRRNIGHWQTRMDVLILRSLKRWTTNYLANSQAAAKNTEDTEHVDSRKISVIHNGLCLEQYKHIGEDIRIQQRQQWGIKEYETLIGTIANLRSVKNIGSLVSTATNLIQTFPMLSFVVVGEGEERDNLQKLINDNGLSNSFQLVGMYSNILPCLAAFDIGVLCSTHESFSNALIEYMAGGLPIVASDVGGNCEAIIHEETGILYSIDDIHGLTHALRRIIEDETLVIKVSGNARNRAHIEYSKSKILQDYETYYETVWEKNHL